MRFKRLLALLLAAALALSLLAGCGGSKALSQVIVDLLDGLYSNVSVEADSDLTAALKQAAAEGGTEEEILSRMIEILNHKGGSITFTRLGSGQQGDHAVTLYFQTGTDPDAAARNALAQWAGVLGTLPDDGNYQADVAMIETENGYYIALDVEVLKAGKADKPDKDDDDNQDDGLIHADGMAYDPDQGSATISGENGLTSLVETLQKVAGESGTTLAATIGETNITLTSDATLPADWPYEATYEATFDGGGNTVKGVSSSNEGGFNGMFSTLTGTVKNVQFEAVEIDGGSGENGNFNGAVAGFNDGGTVENCVVLSGTISGYESTGALVGWNSGEIKNCKSAATVNGSSYNTGGIAGYNAATITGCEYAATVNGSAGNTGGIAGYNEGTISDSTNTGNVDSAGWFVGGIVGLNADGSSISGCNASGDVTAEYEEVGGIVGRNNGTIRNSSFTGNKVQGAYDVGGIVGSNTLEDGMANSVIVEACHSTGVVISNGMDAGGIAGKNMSASVIARYSTANVQGSGDNIGGVVGTNGQIYGSTVLGVIDTCYATGNITGGRFVGGVAGRNGHSNDNQASVNACYATGSVSGTTTGGVIGSNQTLNVVTNCYWQNNAANGIGTDGAYGSLPSDRGSTRVDDLTTWEAATNVMNQNSKSSIKFVYSDGAPTLPI